MDGIPTRAMNGCDVGDGIRFPIFKYVKLSPWLCLFIFRNGFYISDLQGMGCRIKWMDGLNSRVLYVCVEGGVG